MVEGILLEIITVIVGFLLGWVLSKVVSEKKYKHLVGEIIELRKQIEILNAKYDNIETLRYNNFDNERRISDLESKNK